MPASITATRPTGIPSARSDRPAMPYSVAAKPTAERNTEGTSKYGRVGSSKLRTSSKPTIRASATSGSMRMKIQRQPKECSTKPENVGPSAGATAMTTETKPKTPPRRSSGTSRMIVVMSSGITSAVPEA